MNTDNVYLKMLTAPIWGLAFLMFLPAIGFYLTAKALIGMGLRRFGLELAWITEPTMVGEAHLIGQQPRPEGLPNLPVSKVEEEVLKARQGR